MIKLNHPFAWVRGKILALGIIKSITNSRLNNLNETEERDIKYCLSMVHMLFAILCYSCCLITTVGEKREKGDNFILTKGYFQNTWLMLKVSQSTNGWREVQITYHSDTQSSQNICLQRSKIGVCIFSWQIAQRSPAALTWN